MPEKKLICVVGATGNQGGSVARRFLQDPRFTVRGLTRNTSSPAAQALAALGAEMVSAELDDVETLKAAFRGANLIFSVTQYWEPFFRPDCRAKAQELGVTCRRYAYDVEYRQGKNIADAAATVVDTLDENGFLVSTLSHAGKCTKGAVTDLYHFDSKADIFPDYVDANYPALAAKMSCIHTGYFFTSYNILPDSYFSKQPDGSFQMRFTTAPDRLVPHLDVNADTGNFVYAVSQMPPGKAYMAAGSNISWTEWITRWGKATGSTVSYKQISHDEMVADTPDKDCGIEVALMYSYASDPGYDGGMELLTAEDLRKAGIDCPMTTADEYFANTDWSAILAK
ncbi:NAD(P)-binding protein [Apodospora peruviana]|uniref:NAD(P)-binding protein n=1 Tax=Apodospora peruviana TaxID=516989 RepID=A0AAE0I022_9PEZI|nr:NAD(P)-binding protein [Apodospora peruviana]